MNEPRSQSARDFFDLFSFEPLYDIDLVELKNRYRELQLKFHPDQYSSDSSSERMAAVKMSSLLNDAFEVLSQPVKRAQYLLAKSGIDLQKDRNIDSSILIEQMELRERFEDISFIDNEDEKEEKLECFSEELNTMFMACDRLFSAESKKGLNDVIILENLKQILTRMLFLKKLMSELARSLESLD